jgi:hypothetical protein
VPFRQGGRRSPGLAPRGRGTCRKTTGAPRARHPPGARNRRRCRDSGPLAGVAGRRPAGAQAASSA